MTRRLTYIPSSEPGEADECYYQQACPTEERWSEEIGLTPVDGEGASALDVSAGVFEGRSNVSQILMVFHHGQAMFRSAGHLRFNRNDTVRIFGRDDEAISLEVTGAWTTLTAESDVELVELDAPRECGVDVLRAAGFCPLRQSYLMYGDRVVIEKLLRQLKGDGQEVADADELTAY